MKLRKITGFIGLGALVLSTAFALQGCFESTPPYYGYGYGPSYAYNNPGYVYSPAPVYAAPPVVGDWDEHHVWHNQEWWEHNRHPWVAQHHPEWLAQNHRGPEQHYDHGDHDHH